MFRVCFIIITIFSSFQTNAIVNIEKVNISEDADPVQGEIDFNVSGASGNSETQSTSLGGRIQWNDVSTKFIVLKYDYAESSDIKNTDKTFFHSRYINNARDKVTWETYFQLQDDTIKFLTLRSLLGAGYRISLFSEKKKNQARLGLGLFVSREELTDVTQTPSDIIDEVVRANIYFTYQYKIEKGVSFLSMTYYQPDIDNTSDYRALEQLSLEFDISEKLLYFMTLDFTYDNKPFAGLDKDDTSYKSGIKYRF